MSTKEATRDLTTAGSTGTNPHGLLQDAATNSVTDATSAALAVHNLDPVPPILSQGTPLVNSKGTLPNHLLPTIAENQW